MERATLIKRWFQYDRHRRAFAAKERDAVKRGDRESIRKWRIRREAAQLIVSGFAGAVNKLRELEASS